MKTIRNILLLLTLALSIVLLPACGNDDDPLAPVVESFDGVIDAGGELDSGATIRKFRIVRAEGSNQVARQIDHYSIPVNSA